MNVSHTADRQQRFSQRDVTLLVDMLRLSRVTLLIAEKGADKSAVLQSAVIPLLQDRKQGADEIVVLFDEWDKPPVPALHAIVRQYAGAAGAAVTPPGAGSFISNLEAWQQAIGRTFLIILDRFEDFLRAPRDAPGIAEFETAFAQIANDPTLRANFLVAVDEDAEPLLANLRRYIPRLGYSSVRLPRPGIEGDAAAADLKAAADLDTSTTLADEAQPAGMTAAAPPVPSLTLVPASAAPAVAEEKPGEVPETLSVATGVPAASRAAQIESHESTLGTDTAEPEVREPSPALMRVIAELKQAMAELEKPASTVEAAKPAREAPKLPAEAIAPVRSIGADAPDSAPAQLQGLADERTLATHPPSRTLDRGPSQKRFARVAWTLAFVIPAVAFLFWGPQSKKPVDGNAAAPATVDPGKAPEREASRAKPASSTPDRRPAPAAVAAPAAEVAVAKAPPAPPAETTAAEPTPAKARPSVAPPAPAAAERAPAKAPASTAMSVAASNPSTTNAATAAATPAFSAPPQDLRKPAAAAAKPPQALPKTQRDERAPAATAKPQDVPSKPQPAESAPPARAAAVTTGSSVSTPRSTAEPAAPVLRINVRNEAQRAWAKQLVGPLKERGIQVSGIRMVPAHADGAHIRYYRGTDRNEAMRVAGALGELGLSARHLKQMDASDTAPPRQYELWLSSADKR